MNTSTLHNAIGSELRSQFSASKPRSHKHTHKHTQMHTYTHTHTHTHTHTYMAQKQERKTVHLPFTFLRHIMNMLKIILFIMVSGKIKQH